MPAFTEDVHKFRSDEAGASDDDDLHGYSPRVDCNHCVGVEQDCLRTQVESLRLSWVLLGDPLDLRPKQLSFVQSEAVQRVSSCLIISVHIDNRLGHGVEGAAPGDAYFAVRL